MDMITAMLLICCLCFVFFNFGQMYAIIRGMREDDERHAKEMRRIRESR
jgi:hypothetical protein